MEKWLSHRTHNPEAAGSNPAPATHCVYKYMKVKIYSIEKDTDSIMGGLTIRACSVDKSDSQFANKQDEIIKIEMGIPAHSKHYDKVKIDAVIELIFL